MAVQHSKILFEESIKSKASLESYTWYVGKFIEYYKLNDFDSILKIEQPELEKMIATYIIHLKKKVNPNSIPAYCKPLKLFLEVNDVELKWKKLNRLLPEKIKQSGNTAWQTEDIQKMLSASTQLKNKALVHLLVLHPVLLQ